MGNIAGVVTGGSKILVASFSALHSGTDLSSSYILDTTQAKSLDLDFCISALLVKHPKASIVSLTNEGDSLLLDCDVAWLSFWNSCKASGLKALDLKTRFLFSSPGPCCLGGPLCHAIICVQWKVLFPSRVDSSTSMLSHVYDHPPFDDVVWDVDIAIQCKLFKDVFSYDCVQSLLSVDTNDMIGCMGKINKGLGSGAEQNLNQCGLVLASACWTLHTQCPELHSLLDTPVFLDFLIHHIHAPKSKQRNRYKLLGITWKMFLCANSVLSSSSSVDLNQTKTVLAVGTSLKFCR